MHFFDHFAGNIAKEHNDVGRYADEDRCCREHDLCPNTLSPGECKRGLCNNQKFTRSHCDCDSKFRKCLQGLNTGNNINMNIHVQYYLFTFQLYGLRSCRFISFSSVFVYNLDRTDLFCQLYKCLICFLLAGVLVNRATAIYMLIWKIVK